MKKQPSETRRRLLHSYFPIWECFDIVVRVLSKEIKEISYLV